MINDKLHIFKDIRALSHGLTDFILDKAIANQKNTSIALSGGSTPKALFNYWAGNYPGKIPWNDINFFWGDERCVPPDNEMSNYGMTKEYLFDRINIPASNIFRIRGENDPGKEAYRYSEVLSKKLGGKNGIPEFGLIILGLGDDGHTASIFPHQIGLWDSNENCIVANHPETGTKRISITGRIINNALHTIFLVTGKNKAEKVRDIINNREAFIDTYPAARVSPKNRELHWFLDDDAASLL